MAYLGFWFCLIDVLDIVNVVYGRVIVVVCFLDIDRESVLMVLVLT